MCYVRVGKFAFAYFFFKFPTPHEVTLKDDIIIMKI